ncbi:MAG: hypothetical protein JXR51_16565 [Bacteroidales bacterium]|nr:hypothetical protein [Bacteroidales bacterium]MBN2758781.1 hypothetical protein [Bacteroidales bacterium]
MEINYLCPKCKSFLNIGNKIVLSVKVKNEQKGLMLFEKELGNYQIKKHDLVEYKKGELLGFYCPICHENLALDDVNSNLAKIIMLDENNKEYDVIFSKVAGEHATFKISNNEIEAYGEDSHKYINFFGHSPKY